MNFLLKREIEESLRDRRDEQLTVKFDKRADMKDGDEFLKPFQDKILGRQRTLSSNTQNVQSVSPVI